MSKLSTITKRSGTGILRNSTKVLSAQQWATVVDNLASDIAQLVTEHNDKIKAVLDGLAKGADDSISGLDSAFDAIAHGLDGTVEFTDRSSTSSDPNYIYSKVLTRPLTIKESIAEVYTLLSQEIDAILIESEIEISDYTKAYIGEKAFDSSLTSSATSMDGRISALEDEVDDIPVMPIFSSGRILFGDGTTTPDTDDEIFWDNTNKRVGIGTLLPEKTLDVRGTVRVIGGVISGGGDARGDGASDFQTLRTTDDQVALGTRSFVAGGASNKASGTNSFATGQNCSAVGNHSFVTGKGSIANIDGARAHASGSFDIIGDAQFVDLIVLRLTTDDLPTLLFVDGADPISIEDNSAVGAIVDVIARSDTGDVNHYILQATIERGVGPATVALVGSVLQTVVTEDMATADATIIADTIDGSLGVQVTGVAATNIRWVAHVKITSVTF